MSGFDEVFGDIFGDDAEEFEVTPATEVEEEVIDPVMFEYEGWVKSDVYPDCTTCTVPARELFPMIDSDIPVRKYSWDKLPPIEIPEVDPIYVPDVEALSTIITSAHLGLKAMLYGDTGSGKTSLLEYFAAMTKRPFARIQFDDMTDDQKLFGNLDLNDEGGTYYNKSLMVQSFDWPTICTLDELSRATAAVTMLMNPVLDRGTVQIVSKGGEGAVAKASKEFLIFATDNTVGNGDGLDVYNSSNVLDEAIRNRLHMYQRVPYPSKSVVADILTKIDPCLSSNMKDKLVKFTGQLQQGFTERTITTAWSNRNLKAVVALLNAGMDVKEAITINYVNRVLDCEKEDVKEAMRVIFH